MSVCLPQINKAQPTKSDTQERRWIYVPYNRLTDRTGQLHETNPEQCGTVMAESLEKGSRRPYHKKKLALVLSNKALRARAAEAMNELAHVPRPEYQATGTENR
jgi:deoxyribodipyrimidine photolyase-related protein